MLVRGFRASELVYMAPPSASWSWAATCGWCGRRRKSGGGIFAGDDDGGTGGGGGGGIFIDLPVLEAATAGFSDLNLLGRGGFGPVYKANQTPFL